MQNDLAPNTKYSGIGSTFSELWAEGGVRAFYRGVVPRTARIIGSVLIYNEANNQLSKLARAQGYT